MVALPKDDLSVFWCPYISTVQEMSQRTYTALGCSVADIRDELFEDVITDDLFKKRKVANNYTLKQPGNCFPQSVLGFIDTVSFYDKIKK